MKRIQPEKTVAVDYLTLQQAATKMSVTKETVKAWIKDGIIEHLKIKNQYYVKADFVQTLETKQKDIVNKQEKGVL